MGKKKDPEQEGDQGPGTGEQGPGNENTGGPGTGEQGPATEGQGPGIGDQVPAKEKPAPSLDETPAPTTLPPHRFNGETIARFNHNGRRYLLMPGTTYRNLPGASGEVKELIKARQLVKI